VSGWAFRRGFVEQVTGEAERLLQHGDEVFEQHPVRHVRCQGSTRLLRNFLASRHLRGVAVLDLSGLAVSLVAVQALAGSPHLAGLRELHLAETGADDEAARALAGSPHLAGLAVLGLGNNLVGDGGAEVLAQSAHLQGLAVLDLRSNLVSDAGRAALRARFGGRVRV
jgi:hypothetical protein